jgi:DNA topoisomerase-1
VVARVGRYGPYVQIGDSERRANLPTELPLDELTVEKALDLLSQSASSNRSVGTDPATGLPVFVKVGRFGPYIQVGEPVLDAKGKRKKDAPPPRMASLWPGMRPETLTYEQALQLLQFPKVLGKHPETGAEVIASDGQYGPYVYMMTGDGKREARSLTGHDQLRDLTLDEAVALLAQPRVFGRRGASAGTSLGVSPVTSKAVMVKKGQFGVYVTDGEVNATVPNGKDPTALTLEEALELIALREEKLREQGRDPRAEAQAKSGGKRPKAAAKAKPAAAADDDDDAAAAPPAKKPASKKAAPKAKAEPKAAAEPKAKAPAKKPAAKKPAKKRA